MEIAAQISAWLGAGAAWDLWFTAETGGDPAPYRRMLAGWRIHAAVGPSLAEVQGGELILSGNSECLEAFTSFLPVEGGIHSHYEYYEGNDYVSAESIPMVLVGCNQ